MSTPLREAFCDLMALVPGPDATEYSGWARSGDPDDTAELVKYVRDSIAAIRRSCVGGMFVRAENRYHRERAWLPTLEALLEELTTGRVTPEADVAKLVAKRVAETRMLRAREVAETALDAAGLAYEPWQLERAAKAIEYSVGGAE